jgi:hypothetical protein
MAMIIRRVNRAAIEVKPYEAWNAFVNLLSTEKYQDLNEVQRVAYLCFWYDSEVQNGGHLQYFENRGTAFLRETLAALAALGADCQRQILDAAGLLITMNESERGIETVDDYVGAARDGRFAAFDSAYYACKPDVESLLAGYFERNKSDFIEIA